MRYLKVKNFADSRYKFINSEGKTLAVMDVEDNKIIKFVGIDHGRLNPSWEGTKGCRYFQNYSEDIYEFIKQNHFEPVNDLENMGFIKGDDGKIYNLRHLPENFSIKNLDLSHMAYVELPKSFSCENLYLFGSNSISLTYPSKVKNMYAVGSQNCLFLPVYNSYYGDCIVQNYIIKKQDLKGHVLEIYQSYLPKNSVVKACDLSDGYTADLLVTDDAISKETTLPSQSLKDEASGVDELNVYALRNPNGEAFVFFKVYEWSRVETSLRSSRWEETTHIREVVEYNTSDGRIPNSRDIPYILEFITEMGLTLPPADLYGYNRTSPTEFPKNFEPLGIYTSGVAGDYYTLQDLPTNYLGKELVLAHKNGLDFPNYFEAPSVNLCGAANITIGNNALIDTLDLQGAQNVVIGKNAKINYLIMDGAQNIFIEDGLETGHISMDKAQDIVLPKKMKTTGIDMRGAKNVTLPESLDLKRKLSQQQAALYFFIARSHGLKETPSSYFYNHLVLDDQSQVALPPSIPDAAIEGISTERIAQLKKQYKQNKAQKENIRLKIEQNKKAYFDNPEKREMLGDIINKKNQKSY